MNKRLIAVLLFAVVIAGLFSLLVVKIVGGPATKEVKPIATVQVWVAARDVPIGKMIDAGDVTVADWPGAVPASAERKAPDQKVCPWVGRGVVTKIFQGEPIVKDRLAPVGVAGLAAMIPTGMRAVAVRVDEIIGLAGFVVPGQTVDVVISGAPPTAGSSAGMLSKTLLQNVRVLSAGQNLQKDPEGKPVSVTVVNLLVDPTQAEALTLASKQTGIQLVLRNQSDTQEVKTPGTSVARLFLGVKAPGAEEAEHRPRVVKPVVVAPVVKEPPPVTVEVIQGSSRNTVKFAEEGR